MKKLLLTLVAAILAMAANAADWYLVGAAINGQSNIWSDNPSFKLTQSAENADVYTFAITKISGEFKIKPAGTWTGACGTNGSKLKAGVPYTNPSTADGAGNIVVDGTIEDATLTFNSSTHEILIQGKSQENDYSVVYLVGDFGSGWNPDLTGYPLQLKSGTDNVWEGSYTLSAATSYFKMKAGSYVYGTGGSDIAVELNTAYTASQSGNAYTIGAGTYTFSFVLNHNADTGVLTVTSDAPVTYPEKMYVLGSLNNLDMNYDNYVELPAKEGAEGEYAGEVTFGGEMGGTTAYMQFATKQPATSWNDLGTRYGAAEADMPLTAGTEYDVVAANDPFAWAFTPGKYQVELNLATKKVKLTAIDEPEPPVPSATFVFNTAEGLAALTPAIPAFKANGEDGWVADGSNSRYNFPNSNDANDTWGTYTSKDGVKFYAIKTAAAATNKPCIFYTSGVYDARVYNNSTMTLTAPEGYALEEIVFSFPAKNRFNFKLATNEPGTLGAYDANTNTVTWAAPANKEVTALNLAGTGTSRINTINVKIKKVTPPEPQYPELYFRGAPLGWDATDANKMTRENDVYTLKVEYIAGEFKIADADWSADNSWSTKNTAMVAGETYTCTTEDNIANMGMANILTDATVTFNYTTKELKVEGTVNYVDLYFRGADAGWDATDANKMSREGDIYTITLDRLFGEFKIADATWSATNSWSTQNTEMEAGTAYACQSWDNIPNMAMAQQLGNVTVTFNYATKEVKVEGEPYVYPELYFRGADNDWDATEANLMAREGDVYTYKIAKLTGAFKIADALWSAAQSWSSKNMAMEAGETYVCTTEENNANMGMATGLADATVTFNYYTKEIKVEGTLYEPTITYQIKGTFTDPAWVAQEMVKDEQDDTYKYTGALAAESGEFLVIELADGKEVNWFKSAESLTATASEITLSASASNNVKYDFTGADVKEITFVFTPATGALKATWTTGIEGIAADFDSEAEYYTLQGARVTNPATGLYIVVRSTGATKEYLVR